jgi:hypothetical protein
MLLAKHVERVAFVPLRLANPSKNQNTPKERFMINLKNKASETAEHVVNVVSETVDKVAHATTEALHKGEHALSDMARKAVGLAPEPTDKPKEAGEKVVAKSTNGFATNGVTVKSAADKATAGKTTKAADKAKKTAN